MPVEIIEKELSYKVVQAAYEVFNGLGPGFLEKIYEEAMVLVLRKNGHKVEVQKSVPEIAPIHKQQALSYLKATGLPLALVINFGAHR
jgi:PD-(D/E)XK nuclease superfamily